MQEVRPNNTPGIFSSRNSARFPLARSDSSAPGIVHRPLEDRVSAVVDAVFAERKRVSVEGEGRRSGSVEGEGRRSSSCGDKPGGRSRDGLTYDEFCDSLEKNSELSELLNLFYDWGMPDLPVPHDTLAPNLLTKENRSSFLCGRDNDPERPNFLGIPFSSTRSSSISSGSSAQQAAPIPSGRRRTTEFDNSPNNGAPISAGSPLLHPVASGRIHSFREDDAGVTGNVIYSGGFKLCAAGIGTSNAIDLSQSPSKAAVVDCESTIEGLQWALL